MKYEQPHLLPFPRFEDARAENDAVAVHPENGVHAFLETCASSLGLALDREAKTCALRTLRSFVLDEDTMASVSSAGGGQSSSKGRKLVTPCGGDGGNTASQKKGDVISSTESIFAAVSGALTKALVHCERFEVSMVKLRTG